MWLIVVSLFLLSFYSSHSVEYNNRWTRAGRDGEEQTSIGPTQATTETQDGTGGQEQPTGASSIIFNSFYSPSHSSSFRLPLFLQSTPTGGTGSGVSEGKGPSRKNHCEDEAQKQKDERDFRLGEGDGGRSSRSLALGADSQKGIVLIAQHQSKICN